MCNLTYYSINIVLFNETLQTDNHFMPKVQQKIRTFTEDPTYIFEDSCVLTN